MPRPHPDRIEFRLHRGHWVLPVLALGLAGLLFMMAASLADIGAAPIVVLGGFGIGLLACTAWWSKRLFFRVIADDDGLEVHEFRRPPRHFPWDDLRKIRDEERGFGQYAYIEWRVTAAGGRGFRFTDKTLSRAEALATMILAEIQARRDPIGDAPTAGMSAPPPPH